MQLPNTAWIALNGPHPILDFGYSWFPSPFTSSGSLVAYDETRVSHLVSLRKNIKLFLKILKEKYNWSLSHVFLMGFSQGALVSIDMGLHWNNESDGGLLGGCIGISGVLLDECVNMYKSKDEVRFCLGCSIPLFVSHGVNDEMVKVESMREKVEFIRGKMPHVEMTFKEYPKKHEMISSKEEMRDLMQFFAKYLYRPQVHLGRAEGVVEVTGNLKQQILSQYEI